MAQGQPFYLANDKNASTQMSAQLGTPVGLIGEGELEFPRAYDTVAAQFPGYCAL